MTATGPDRGALVISLDFELWWGWRDVYPDGGFESNLLGARRAIPQIVDRFVDAGIAATWATVGMLFASGREELLHYRPDSLPTYVDPSLSPYDEESGESEDDDPLRFAPSLVSLIASAPRQEIATHTFSHYYCLEPGQTKEQFRADIRSARAIASAAGVHLNAIVFPRNQANPSYASVLADEGISVVRGNPKNWMYEPRDRRASRAPYRRVARLADAYLDLSGHHLVPWSELVADDGSVDVRASRFLRPYSRSRARLEGLRMRRIRHSMTAAAQRREVIHLWWHPEDFGSYTEENLEVLDGVIEHYRRLEDEFGLSSLTMSEAAEVARGGPGYA